MLNLMSDPMTVNFDSTRLSGMSVSRERWHMRQRTEGRSICPWSSRPDHQKQRSELMRKAPSRHPCGRTIEHQVGRVELQIAPPAKSRSRPPIADEDCRSSDAQHSESHSERRGCAILRAAAATKGPIPAAGGRLRCGTHHERQRRRVRGGAISPPRGRMAFEKGAGNNRTGATDLDARPGWPRPESIITWLRHPVTADLLTKISTRELQLNHEGTVTLSSSRQPDSA